ncbi:queuosine precursor transporter [Thermomicrobium sp. CFH 73360]|uniref:queuosine precursor transporter n=1 Tax=Thermomicrobium sp. CFH 73360 TaxID=2951987 RepID=UPI0020773F24|nr:queuosine precursor transporter [Thermomicrobium sp. CFH 73360]MCM8746511.1 queuosine precursor transporter [Thermomicrobium sp. CFH 73360]
MERKTKHQARHIPVELGPGQYSRWFVAITALFVTTLITSNIVAVKIVDVWGLYVPAGTVTVFPLAYIFGDVLTEVYGYRRARLVIWLGFACNLLAVAAFTATQYLPAAPFWDGQAAYERILGYTPRLLAASFLAYLIGEFANAAVLSRLKLVTRGRFLWIRTIGSTLVGQGLDSLVFVTVAFLGTMAGQDLVRTIVTAWLVKSAYEAVATPLTYVIVNALKRVEGIDTFDYGVSLSPFQLD